MRYWIAALLGIGGLVGLAGCDSAARSGNATGKRRVVATTMMIGDLVRQIGGEQVELKTIMGPAVDPHTYKPSPSDFASLKNADLIFYNGLHLEGKMVDLLEERLSGRAVVVTRDIPRQTLLAWKAGQTGAHDPHVWFDVSLWMQAARTVGQELARVDPEHAAEYQQRLARLLEEMEALDQEIRRQVQKVSTAKRVVITSHDAFSYFGRAYGFDVRGIQGISTETEAGLLGIQGAVDFIVKNRIPAIFIESSVSPKAIERVRDDCRARGFEVRIGGELFSDAMGTPGQHPPFPVETYVGMMRYNVNTIVQALAE